ncbi:MAG: BamA/TamA family outer membrane protein [Deltaproteobacteria bacterium]|nr:BamA/TamA family outer membrane protein [Deltaproteobacteria bacterium]
MRHRAAGAARLLALAVLVLPTRCAARESLDTERMLGDVIQQAAMDGAAGTAPGGGWGVLPQVGYSPDKGTNAGLKFTDRSFTAQRMTLDVEGSYALKRQRNASFGLVAPHIFGDTVILALQGEYLLDPTKEFFGLGNNEVGPDPLSTNEYRLLSLLGTVAVRPRQLPRLTLALTGGFTDVRIGRGDLEGSTPSTVDVFPDLEGIQGGRTHPIALSVVYNNREEITRPTRGWNLIAKVQHVNRRLGNDFQFTRYILDASYLYPLLTRRQVLGLRVGGEYVASKRGQVPFYELSSLGGAETVRGFFLDRFLGRSRVMINGEYRLGLLDFDFFDLWRVRVDGVAFGDMGRVFIDRSDLSRQFRLNPDTVPDIFRDFRYSYGAGTRVALGEAILARIDVGFSEEETALVYLTFGHIF